MKHDRAHLCRDLQVREQKLLSEIDRVDDAQLGGGLGFERRYETFATRGVFADDRQTPVITCLYQSPVGCFDH